MGYKPKHNSLFTSENGINPAFDDVKSHSRGTDKHQQGRAHPVGKQYLRWFRVVYSRMPFSSKPALLMRVFSCREHMLFSFRFAITMAA